MHAAAVTPLAPRQRWRITFSRDADPARRTHRDIADAWGSAIVEAGLPLARPAGRPRSPLAFAAPLPAGMRCRSELADLLLAELCHAWWVRGRLAATLPPGLHLVDVEDVWLGAPALAAAIRAADYTVALARADDAAVVAAASATFMAAPSIERERARGAETVRYDIRPLVDDVHVESGDPPILWIRVLFHPDRGAGRPDEVVAALADLGGRPIETGPTVRERLILDD